MPPLGDSTWPVTQPPSGPSSQQMSDATSSGVPSRPTRVCAARSRRDSLVSLPAQNSVSGTKPGATALAVPPHEPSSRARSYTKACSAALAAPYGPPPLPRSAATDESSTTRPPSRSIASRSASTSSTAVSTLDSKDASQSRRTPSSSGTLSSPGTSASPG